MVSGSAYQVRSSRRETRRLRSSCSCRSAQSSRASRSSATSLGGAHRRLSTPAGRAPRPLPPRSLPARGSHRREQPKGSMKAAADPPDLPPPGSQVLSGLGHRPLPAARPNPEPRAQAPPRPRSRPPEPRPSSWPSGFCVPAPAAPARTPAARTRAGRQKRVLRWCADI